ncbi:MAG: Ubiquinone biosynthesis O-methyltransferase [bacterium]|nr:Ubiquinone biosynthesis O-methyltransferase [bacterium]
MHSTEQQIIHSWNKNAGPWIRAVQEEQIESRKLVTNQAIIATILRYRPPTALDLGCGEGWLARQLATHGIRVMGVDAVPALIENANRLGGGEFAVYAYEQIVNGVLNNQFAAVVCNFSLLGKESVDHLIRQIPALLHDGGHLFIQTLHPLMAGGDAPYQDGWRSGSWAGFSAEFSDPAPWYFRTMGTWIKLFRDSKLTLTELLEPLHPNTGKPVSLLLVGTK